VDVREWGRGRGGAGGFVMYGVEVAGQDQLMQPRPPRCLSHVPGGHTMLGWTSSAHVPQLKPKRQTASPVCRTCQRPHGYLKVCAHKRANPDIHKVDCGGAGRGEQPRANQLAATSKDRPICGPSSHPLVNELAARPA
jgi:hypothetical protein